MWDVDNFISRFAISPISILSGRGKNRLRLPASNFWLSLTRRKMASFASRTPAFQPLSQSSFFTRVIPARPVTSPVRQRPPFVCVSRPPKRIGSVAKDLQSALQLSLQSRTSRIDLRLPSGARLGIEPRTSDEDVIQRRQAGDREAARLVAAMFEGTGLSVSVVFESARQSAAARKKWGPVESGVEDWGNRKEGGSKKKGKKRKGFGSSSEAEEKGKVDVYVMAGGGVAFLERVRLFAGSVGMDTLVILVNANSELDTLPIDLECWKADEFESVYHYEPDPHPMWNGGVLFRKFPDGTFLLPNGSLVVIIGSALCCILTLLSFFLCLSSQLHQTGHSVASPRSACCATCL